MTITIKKNSDGSRNLRSLRSALRDSGNSVYKQGNSWMISELRKDHNFVYPAPHWANERDAIEMALGLELSRNFNR
jgi:hypothetical protein